jgi:hypothetical protein
MTFNEVVEAIANERRFQSNRWGSNKEQSLAGYLLIMRKELDEAIDGWMKNDGAPRQSCLEEIVQVVATGVACLETYGIKGCARSTNDITEAELLAMRQEASLNRFGAR